MDGAEGELLEVAGHIEEGGGSRSSIQELVAAANGEIDARVGELDG